MTPLEIDILLHYYTTTGDYRDGDFSAPVFRELIPKMLREELLYYSDGVNRKYLLSDRGTAYIEMLMATPLPVLKPAQWLDPRMGDIA